MIGLQRLGIMFLTPQSVNNQASSLTWCLASQHRTGRCLLFDLNGATDAHWGKACKTRHSNTEELKVSANSAWRSMRIGFVRKVLSNFRPRIERVIAAKGGHVSNLISLGVNISLSHKSCFVSFQITLM